MEYYCKNTHLGGILLQKIQLGGILLQKYYTFNTKISLIYKYFIYIYMKANKAFLIIIIKILIINSVVDYNNWIIVML